MLTSKFKLLVSGGGTGGHIFPAIAIAQAVQEACDAEVLFVGAQGKMEMEKVPAAGFKIVGLPITGLKRSFSLQNVLLVSKLWQSIRLAKKIIKDFKPDAVIGVGGYASGPMLIAAQWKGLPTYLQEQNAFAGITNRLLARKIRKAFVAFEGLERVFGKDKVTLSGNPVRNGFDQIDTLKSSAYAWFGLKPSKLTVLVTGGSLGAATINSATAASLNLLLKNNIQLIWQTGKNGIEKYSKLKQEGVWINDFVERMDYAYSIADVVVARAGASTISELAIVRRPAILIPSPNVAEDHQTKNALSLVNKNAAIMLKDHDAVNQLPTLLLNLCTDEDKRNQIKEQLKSFDHPNAAAVIAKHLLNDWKNGR